MLRGNPVLWLLSFLSTYRFPTTEFLEQYTGPLLVVHGDADSIIRPELGRRVFDAAPSPRKTFVPLPGVDHNDPYFDTSPEYWRAIDRFLGTLVDDVPAPPGRGDPRRPQGRARVDGAGRQPR